VCSKINKNLNCLTLLVFTGVLLRKTNYYSVINVYLTFNVRLIFNKNNRLDYSLPSTFILR